MFCRQDPNSRMQLNQWWSHQIHDTPSRDSADPLLHGLRLGLQTELNFWKARKDNLLLKKKNKLDISGIIANIKENFLLDCLSLCTSKNEAPKQLFVVLFLQIVVSQK